MMIMMYWMVLDDSGWFWMVLDGSGWVWLVLGGSGWFRCLALPAVFGILMQNTLLHRLHATRRYYSIDCSQDIREVSQLHNRGH